MQLKHKLPLILFVAYVALTGSLVVYALANSSKVRGQSQREATKAYAQNYSDRVASFMSERIGELRSLETSMSVIKDLDEESKANSIEKLLKKLANQPIVSDVYISYEEKNADKPYITEPAQNKITIVYPIAVDGKPVGAAKMDLDLRALQRELFDAMKDEATGSYVILVSNSGLRAAHPKQELLLTPTGNDLPAAKQKDLLSAISAGQEHIITEKNLLTGEESIMAYFPMKFGNVELPWSLCYVLPLTALRAEELEVRYRTLSQLLLIDILWGLFLLWLMSKVFGHLTRTVALLGKMTEGEGNLTIRFAEGSKDEIGQMSRGL
ncbi:MAG: cache domain-containing protein, partial [Fibromonadales bacterium]|nr:cache domain-containing protein [Fibromonadales bacterium]